MRQMPARSRAELVGQRPAGVTADVHFTESFAAAVVGEYSQPGQVVLDPFAGFGTTLLVAMRMGRRAVGVELLAERGQLVRRRAGGGGTVVTGDARRLASLVTGPFDLCLTSPPYMTAHGHPQNPLSAYRSMDGDYATYLAELEAVFAAVSRMLRPGGHLVVNVADVAGAGGVTLLARDIGGRVAAYLRLRQDVVLCWDEPPPGVIADHCLVFQKDEAAEG